MARDSPPRSPQDIVPLSIVEPIVGEWFEIRCRCCSVPHLLYRQNGTYIEVWCRQGKQAYIFDLSLLLDPS